MAELIRKAARIEAAGHPPKTILEFIGRVNSGTDSISIARMISPSGWNEPAQTPEFEEYTIVLRGLLHVETGSASFDVHEGEAIVVSKGEWVRYSSPGPDGAEYIAVCIPAFAPSIVHRDDQG